MAKQRTRRGGRLRDTIEIKTVTKVENTTYGGATETLTTFASRVRCDIKTLTSTKGAPGETDAIDGGATFRIDLRYRPGITKKHRIAWGTRELDITGINTDDQHTGWMYLMARERDLD